MGPSVQQANAPPESADKKRLLPLGSHHSFSPPGRELSWRQAQGGISAKSKGLWFGSVVRAVTGLIARLSELMEISRLEPATHRVKTTPPLSSANKSEWAGSNKTLCPVEQRVPKSWCVGTHPAHDKGETIRRSLDHHVWRGEHHDPASGGSCCEAQDALKPTPGGPKNS
jgi:hypothetical protein